MTQKSYSIGELAKTAGVNVETIRFYQRRNLLRQPIKPFSGIRHYTEHDIQRVHFIKQSQKLGFSLDEISELLSLDGVQKCPEAKEIALRKLVYIRDRIKDLRAIEKTLTDLVESCASNTDSVTCPLIQALQETTV